MSYNEIMVYQVYKWEIPRVWKVWMVVLIFLLLLDMAGMAGGIRRALLFIAHPAVVTTSYASSQVVRIIRYGQQLHQAARQNLDLSRRVAELTVQAEQTAALQAENTELRAALNIVTKEPVRQVRGKVVAVSSQELRVWWEGKVAEGSMVVFSGRLVGVVAHATEQVAVVDRLGSGKGQIMVSMVGQPETLGSISRNGSELAIEKVPKSVNVPSESLLVTVGDTTRILPDYPVATTATILAPPEAVYQTVILGSLAELSVGSTVYNIGGHGD